MTEREDERMLLALLNSTPVVEGRPEDRLAVPADVPAWFRGEADAVVDEGEHPALVRARELLQDVVRGVRELTDLAPLLDGVARVPRMTGDGIVWTVDVPDDRRAAARAVLAWDRLAREMPGRLRPCANTECRLFFVDRSRPGTGRWCSMAVCGNRMKARRHQARTRAD